MITYGSKYQYWFGIPRNVSIEGLMMGIAYITHLLVHESNDTDLWIAYNRASGAHLSAMEHLVPEQMFSMEDNPAYGISAVKAIQIAAAEGQKIWGMIQANLSTALAAINLPSEVESDIRNSVYAGMEVTAHEAAINFYGSSQVGYIVIDPETGSGGYLIGGGENGGFILILSGLITAMIGIALLGIALIGGPIATLLLPQIIIASGSLLAAAGFLSIEGERWACSKLMGAAIGMILYSMAMVSAVFGGLAAAAFFGALFSDATSICG